VSKRFLELEDKYFHRNICRGQHGVYFPAGKQLLLRKMGCQALSQLAPDVIFRLTETVYLTGPIYRYFNAKADVLRETLSG
jgi:hypothetical protein